MKAFLLAAGEGTRLRPITYDIPKCLVPVAGRPLMEYWFDLFELHGVTEVLINSSYLADRVKQYVKGINKSFKIFLTYESRLLGSGGTIRKNWDFVEDEEEFYILYADNLTNMNLSNMASFHRKHSKDFTLAVTRVPNPRQCGIIDLDEGGNIVSFIEKPENPVTDLAFAGIMIAGKRLKDHFPEREVFDLGFDVLPRLVGRSSGYVMEDYLLDIGTHEKLLQAEIDIRAGLLRVNTASL